MKKTKAKKPCNAEGKICKKIVITFLREGIHINWAKEMKMAKKLLKEFPKIADWNGIPEENRTNSLAYFLTADGKKFFQKFQNIKDFKFSTQVAESYTVGEKTFGENKIYPNKPKNIFEFINYGKKR